MPLAGQNNVGNIGQMYPLTTTQGTNQYTNTNQASSNNQPFFLLNPAFYEAVPGDIASTALNLINWGITPPGYTPGGLPTEYKVLSGPVGFGPTTYWLRASRSDQTELRAHATSIN